MEFENLIWFIIFLVFVVRVFLKKVRVASKASEKGVAKKLPEWKEKLNKFISQVQQMAEERDTPEDLGAMREEISSERIEQAKVKPPLPKIKPSLEKADAESIEPAVLGTKIPRTELGFGIQDLRKAVIWSEILAPPLALRDE